MGRHNTRTDCTECGIRFAGSGVRLTYGLGLSPAWISLRPNGPHDTYIHIYIYTEGTGRTSYGGGQGGGARHEGVRGGRNVTNAGRALTMSRYAPHNEREKTFFTLDLRISTILYPSLACPPFSLSLSSPSLVCFFSRGKDARTTVNAHYNGFMLLIRTHWPGFE